MVREDRCEYHIGHIVAEAVMDLDGACEAVPDYPVIPPHLCLPPRPFFVFNAAKYCEPGYCTGDDEVSRALLLQSRWEGFETSVALDILSHTPPAWMLDIGSHVGWYSTIAARLGHSVIAFDADSEHLALLRRNTNRSDGGGSILPVEPIHCWIDETTTPMTSPFGGIRLVKIDVEGHERDAIAMIEPLLDRVDFILMEGSPEFANQGDIVGPLWARGFEVYVVPDKGYAGTFAEPIRETMAFPFDYPRQALTSQRTLLFINTRRVP